MPDTFSQTYNSPLFMWLFCVVFSLGVGYIAYRGVNGTTAVNMAINIIQISALVVFSVMAIAYRIQPSGRLGRLAPLQRHAGQLQCGAGQRHSTPRASRCRTPGRTTRPKVDDKKQPIWKTAGPPGGRAMTWTRPRTPTPLNWPA